MARSGSQSVKVEGRKMWRVEKKGDRIVYGEQKEWNWSMAGNNPSV